MVKYTRPRRGNRSGKEHRQSAHKRGYDARWRLAREDFLRRNPLCAFHAKDGRVEAATVVDHIIPHKGDLELFWDESNWQPLCKHCHDSLKRKIEHGKRIVTIGEDGWPIED